MHSSMTHYMELLATNQPWNLLIFMAIPVILAEFIAVTELYILLKKNTTGTLKKLNSIAGNSGGPLLRRRVPVPPVQRRDPAHRNRRLAGTG